MKFTKKTLFLLISFSFLINAQAQELSETLLKVKPGVVGVGTFLPSRSPRSIFLGTGFVIGNGQLIVTNAHVVAKKINTDRLEKWAFLLVITIALKWLLLIK
ncbi:hypothetical protein bplSymb_SCF12502P004 [Bathymodiolus platifrons methanotrophic gill symbiont]|uniref:S1C family serine protease n=1 Tax=Bathymodiolus platifrons methanotrophic gill symbiont TaxID=113268 RepID=UPI000B6AA381|nr:S1C family serine protease [Bathymodiolus platifrons methanotrophic gill symbiont]GAW87652.1 hypothetical protein bplSymb_SCF12502P004 [Bathymodiolus platifrons methanotrophic gill symbiont]